MDEILKKLQAMLVQLEGKDPNAPRSAYHLHTMTEMTTGEMIGRTSMLVKQLANLVDEIDLLQEQIDRAMYAVVDINTFVNRVSRLPEMYRDHDNAQEITRLANEITGYLPTAYTYRQMAKWAKQLAELIPEQAGAIAVIHLQEQ